MTNENKDRLEEAKKESAGYMRWGPGLLKEEIKALREDADLSLQRIEDLTKERNGWLNEKHEILGHVRDWEDTKKKFENRIHELVDEVKQLRAERAGYHAERKLLRQAAGLDVAETKKKG